MISPELRPEVVRPCPPGSRGGAFNDTREHASPSPGGGRLAAVTMGNEMTSQRTTQVVVNGLWHCLLGSLAAGLVVSAVLGGVVLILIHMG